MSSYSFNARIGSHARGPAVVCELGWLDVGMAGVKHLVGRLFPQFHLAQVSVADGSQSPWASRLGLGAARLLDKWCLTPFIPLLVEGHPVPCGCGFIITLRT